MPRKTIQFFDMRAEIHGDSQVELTDTSTGDNIYLSLAEVRALREFLNEFDIRDGKLVRIE